MFLGNPLSISHISNSDDGVECSFTGVDNSYTVVDGAVEVDVGPPQTQVSGRCFELPTPARRSYGAEVTFIGAAGAEFVQYFPVDGHTYSISMYSPMPMILMDRNTNLFFYSQCFEHFSH